MEAWNGSVAVAAKGWPAGRPACSLPPAVVGMLAPPRQQSRLLRRRQGLHPPTPTPLCSHPWPLPLPPLQVELDGTAMAAENARLVQQNQAALQQLRALTEALEEQRGATSAAAHAAPGRAELAELLEENEALRLALEEASARLPSRVCDVGCSQAWASRGLMRRARQRGS